MRLCRTLGKASLNKMMERFHDIHVIAKSFTLVFVPFAEEHHEFIHHEYQIAINKNIITHSKNL